MPKTPKPEYVRYEHWYQSDSGNFALLAQKAMVRRMTSDWPRRGRNLLEIYCGAGHFLEAFWQSGFSVTGQEQSNYLLAKARQRLGRVAEFTQSHPEHLPFDDRSFDYVVCLNGLEFAGNQQAVMNEIFRLASLGVLLAFPNSWSCNGISSHWRVKRQTENESSCLSGFHSFISPLDIQRWLRKSGMEGRINWSANLFGPMFSWKMHRLLERLNLISLPIPLGAFTIARIDLAQALAGNPLLISSRPVLKTETAADGVGRVSKNRFLI
jgi:hypothetical protein